MELPSNLQEALLAVPGPVCLALMVDDLAGVVAKVRREEIEGFVGPIPILYRYELGCFDEGAAIRLYLELHDKEDSSYNMETFLNPASLHDLKVLRRLMTQINLDMHFFDMGLNYGFSKRVNHGALQRRELSELVRRALYHLEAIPPSRRDWQAVKAQFKEARPITWAYPVKARRSGDDDSN